MRQQYCKTHFLTLLLFICGILSFNAPAQVFPVQSTVIIAPPYSPYLSDYTAPGQQKFMVQLRANDITLGDYNVRFRLTIEGVGITLRTREGFVPPPVTLTGGGIPLMLYGEDFLPYFQSASLDFAGLSKREFDKTGKLPEGVYRFSLEVLDYNRGTVVSNKGAATVWVILNDPPLLNLPRHDTKIKILDPTNIPFTWTPRHTGSPNSAFTTDYIFRMVEIWPANRNPYDAFLSQPVLYELTTAQTQIVYGMAEPALIPGRKYAWQVQARDVEGRDLFKNQGRSEVYVFQFGDALGIPENFRREGGNATTLSVRWEPATAGEMADRYRVRYKPQNGERWYEEETQQRWRTLTQLTAGTTYETQVRAERGTLVSEYSATLRLTTTATDPFNCGTEGNIPIPGEAVPSILLAPGDLFYSRNFKFIVTQVRNSNGTFEGEALMPVPWFNGASVKVKFASVRLDKDYQMVTGTYRSVQSTGSELTRVVDEMQKIGEKKKTETPNPADSTLQVTAPAITYTVSGTIDSVFVNDEGNIIVVEEGGRQTEFEPKQDEQTGEAKETVIADGGGNVWVVGKDQATGETKVTKVEGGGLNPGSNTAPASNATPKEKKLIAEILKRFENQIASVLNPVQREPVFPRGAGPMADDFYEPVAPSCMPEDQDQLKIIKEYLSKTNNDEKKLDAFINAVYQNENDKQTIVSIAGKTLLADYQKFEDVLSSEDLQKVEQALCSNALEEAKNYVAELWWRAPYWERAAKILKEHLEDNGLYEDVTVVCTGNECKTIGVIKLSEEVTTTVEVTFSSQISDADTWAILTQHGVDFWEGRSVTLENFKDIFWNYMAMKDDHLYQGKSWESSVLRGFADVLMAPYGAVNGWVTGKHWRTGETLAGWEQALAVLDVVPGEAWAKLGVTAIVVKVGSKGINLAKIKTATRNLLVAVIGRTSRLTLKAGDEFILVAKQGDELAIIGDEMLTIKSAGWIDDVGEAVQLDQAIKLISSEGDVISKVKLIQLVDGSVGFVEIVEGFSSAVNSAVKGRGSLRKALGITNPAKRAHHLIPVKVLKDSDVIQKAVDVGFDFNGKINGFAIDEALHGSHIAYNDFVLKRLDEWRELNKGFSGLKAKKFLEEEFVPFLVEICEEAQKTSTSLQGIVKQL